MPWAEGHVLGVAEMDATHREFIEMADAFLQSLFVDSSQLLQKDHRIFFQIISVGFQFNVSG